MIEGVVALRHVSPSGLGPYERAFFNTPQAVHPSPFLRLAVLSISELTAWAPAWQSIACQLGELLCLAPRRADLPHAPGTSQTQSDSATHGAVANTDADDAADSTPSAPEPRWSLGLAVPLPHTGQPALPLMPVSERCLRLSSTYVSRMCVKVGRGGLQDLRPSYPSIPVCLTPLPCPFAAVAVPKDELPGVKGFG